MKLEDFYGKEFIELLKNEQNRIIFKKIIKHYNHYDKQDISSFSAESAIRFILTDIERHEPNLNLEKFYDYAEIIALNIEFLKILCRDKICKEL